MERPGSVHRHESDAEEIVGLARIYAACASDLAAAVVGGGVARQAPARFCAVHAVELYLNAYLRHCGMPGAELRRMCHDQSARLMHAMARGLRLPNGTALHIIRMSEDRDYLRLRYELSAAATLAPMTRIAATLRDVGAAVDAALAIPPPSA